MELVHGGDWAGYRAEFGRDALDFSANVSPLGLPAGVAAAITAALPMADRYPDPLCRALRTKLAAAEGVDSAQILCGNGAADLIYRLALALRPRRALLPAPTFAEYAAALETVDCDVQRFLLREENDFAVTDGFVDAIDDSTDAVFLCQPNNPTGQVTPLVMVQKLLRRCADCGAVLVVDECFLDFLAAREILEPFIIDYKSYRYRPEIIACFNLVGVVAYYVQEYALSRFYIYEGLKIAQEHSEVSRYAYEYNNLAVTYLAQQDYEKALEAIREAEKNLPVSDEVMHAYIYRNLAEICCHLDRLDEAKDALAKCLANRGREILPEEVRIVNTLLTYRSGDTAGYKRCCAELREHLPQLHAQEFLASCKVLFDCGMDAGDNAQVEWVLDAMDVYLRRDPKEAQVGLRAETCRYEYAKANGNTALMLAALEKKETYYALVLARKEEVRVRDAGRYLHIGQRLHNALESEAGANRTKTRFLANMSHDIRTPINGILGMLEVIRDCRSDEARVDDCLGKIDISAKHLLSLVNDVLDMSKIESNSFVVEAKPFNLARTLVEVDDIVRIQAEQSGLQLYTDHDDVHDADLLGSALYLKKILVNLYSNAIKYNKPGGSITTRLREVSRTADTAVYAFTIRDTGIGMTQDFIDNHLFEAFSQEDNAARSQYGGTGLGMSIVSQLVQKINGTITVESTVGEGSCFTVTLPFAIDHDPPAAGPEKEASTDLHGKRLLVVEDNELNMEIAEFMLKSAGAEVVKAFDGESAVRAFAADPAGCDAILMDLMMPVMDGYAAARAIRAGGQPRAGTVPIIAMSANAYAEDVKKCLDSGMNAHISKPLFKDVMLRTIARFV